MKSKYQVIIDNKTETAYNLEFKKSCQHGTVVIYHFKKVYNEFTGAERIQLSEEYLKELIERGVIEWI